jgi:hypothetical protein
LSGNTNNGIAVISSTDAARATVEDSTLNFNGVGGSGTAGIKLVGVPTTVWISGNTITGNDVGLATSGGQILSFGNNRIDGNNISNGSPTLVLPQD